MHVFRERLSIRIYVFFPFGFVGGMWHLIVLVPGHFLSFHFAFCAVNQQVHIK